MIALAMIRTMPSRQPGSPGVDLAGRGLGASGERHAKHGVQGPRWERGCQGSARDQSDCTQDKPQFGARRSPGSSSRSPRGPPRKIPRPGVAEEQSEQAEAGGYRREIAEGSDDREGHASTTTDARCRLQTLASQASVGRLAARSLARRLALRARPARLPRVETIEPEPGGSGTGYADFAVAVLQPGRSRADRRIGQDEGGEPISSIGSSIRFQDAGAALQSRSSGSSTPALASAGSATPSAAASW